MNNRKTHKITLPIASLIDSGADICLCEKYIALWLGISFKGVKPKQFFAANGTPFDGYPAQTNLLACGKNINCTFYFVDGLPKPTPIILGQCGFFENFKVAFDLKNKEIEIT